MYYRALLITLTSCLSIALLFSVGLYLDLNTIITLAVVGLGLCAIPLGVILRRRFGFPSRWIWVHIVSVVFTIAMCTLVSVLLM